jgi:2-isopropylmalate synthase
MSRYEPFPHISIEKRSWPDKRISTPPIWCSVDLRDGNQALVNPMNPDAKLKMFRMLTKIGFREIEVSFPSASRQDFEFTRMLIEEQCIPENVTIQVLTQSRNDLIKKTFEALFGVKRAIVHIYNSTSPAQREMVFCKSRNEIRQIAVDGVTYARELAEKSNGEFILEYSPESFSQTEHPFAIEICHEVIETWSPSNDKPVIINLPATVEAAPPHVYADQIEIMSREFRCMDNVIISVHTHNDRGCAVAAAELAQCAGAQRVEGTLFGNGERTGNADIMTMALNMYTQGIDPDLDFSDVPEISRIYAECTKMVIPPRHPYAGELVFTAFSGSHQDAINKSMKYHSIHEGVWNIPYIPIDPTDIGRENESIIRINSQSGKGGAAHILEKYHGYSPPREIIQEIGESIKDVTSFSDAELSENEIGFIFRKTFFNVPGPYRIFDTLECSVRSSTSILSQNSLTAFRFQTPYGDLDVPDQQMDVTGINECIVSFLNEKRKNQKPIVITMFSTDQLKKGGITAYVQIQSGQIQKSGAATDSTAVNASIRALCSALNRITT